MSEIFGWNRAEFFHTPTTKAVGVCFFISDRKNRQVYAERKLG